MAGIDQDVVYLRRTATKVLGGNYPCAVTLVPSRTG